jgi:hypothetical protein
MAASGWASRSMPGLALPMTEELEQLLKNLKLA